MQKPTRTVASAWSEFTVRGLGVSGGRAAAVMPQGGGCGGGGGGGSLHLQCSSMLIGCIK